MTVFQVGLTVLAALIFVFAPYFEAEPTDAFSFSDFFVIIGLACLVANIVCFVVFVITRKTARKAIILPGIRNMLLIPSALLVSEMHHMGWIRYEEEDRMISELGRYDIWQPEYLWYAITWAVLTFAVFSLIDAIIERKK